MDVGCSWMRQLASSPSPLLHAKLVSRSSSSSSSYAAAAAAAPPLTPRASAGAGAHGKVLLKGMSYPELEKWVQGQGFRRGQALMLWKRLYGNDAWAHSSEELEGLNENFKQMLSAKAEFRALNLKDIRTASDGTRKILFSLVDALR